MKFRYACYAFLFASHLLLVAGDDEQNFSNLEESLQEVVQPADIPDEDRSTFVFKWLEHLAAEAPFGQGNEKVDLQQIMHLCKQFVRESTFPFSNAPQKQIDKTALAMFRSGFKGESQEQLLARVQYENQIGVALNEQGNIAACAAPLSLIPVRRVRAIGLLACGAVAACKYSAKRFYPLYDLSMLEKKAD